MTNIEFIATFDGNRVGCAYQLSKDLTILVWNHHTL